MKYLSDKYTKVITHKGVDICILKIAVPQMSDELGYKIDDHRFCDVVYELVADAAEAIDSLDLKSKAVIMRDMKIGDLVKFNDKYWVSDKNKSAVLRVMSNPFEVCGTVCVLLEGRSGDFAVDGLEKVTLN